MHGRFLTGDIGTRRCDRSAEGSHHCFAELAVGNAKAKTIHVLRNARMHIVPFRNDIRYLSFWHLVLEQSSYARDLTIVRGGIDICEDGVHGLVLITTLYLEYLFHGSIRKRIRAEAVQ